MRRAHWWQQPVGLRALIWVVATVGVLWLALMGVGLWTFYRHWLVTVGLRDQPIVLRLPSGLQATAEVRAPVNVPLKMRPQIRVPLDQSIVAQLDEPILAQVKLRSTLPIDTVVPVSVTVPIDTRLQMRVQPRSWLPTVDVDVPVHLEVPVQWRLPVQARIPLNLDVLVSGHLRHTVQVPIKADWVLRPEVDAQLQAQVQGQTVFTLKQDVVGMPLTIERADLWLPFDLTLTTGW